MKCPHCKVIINDNLTSRHLASKGGKAGKRKISQEAQEKMQAARKKKKADLEQEAG